MAAETTYLGWPVRRIATEQLARLTGPALLNDAGKGSGGEGDACDEDGELHCVLGQEGGGL